MINAAGIGTSNMQSDTIFRQNPLKHVEGARSAFTLKGQQESQVHNAYFSMAKDGVVEYNGVSFNCNYKTGALELGNCSTPYSCIRVNLEKGGSLLFNPDSTDGVMQAIDMFSAEDQKRIMQAIEKYKMAQQKIRELEDDENADPRTEIDDDKEKTDKEKVTDNEEKNEDEPDIAKSYIAVLKERTDYYEIYDVA